MRLALKDSRLGLRNSTTRIPFRYGTACLTHCPQAILRAVIETNGRVQHGYSGDCLPPSWFDKSPDKDYATQIDDMLRVIEMGQSVYADEFAREKPFFTGWLAAQERVQHQCRQRQLPPLLASFGSSMIERAILDAMCRGAGVSLATAVRSNHFGIEAQRVHTELAGLQPRDWLPEQPRTSVFVRQTVGLGDPLTQDDIPAGETLRDGWPQAIEDYLVQRGVRYFKVKVSNRLEADLDRLTRFAALLERHLGDRYLLTLDGNEQYKKASEFEQLVGEVTSRPALATLWRNVLVIEQPLERRIALNAEHTSGLRNLSRIKPVIIDESDGSLHAFAEAIDLGYRGVSSKNCKGAIKSLLNAGLAWNRNALAGQGDYWLTGEDLCSVGVIPTQSDLCLAATLGLDHVERNGHHYHPGLTYLPASQQHEALSKHGDFYVREHGIIGPNIVDGRFSIGSLQCAGFGFAVEPDMADYTPAAEWQFESLG